MTKLLGYAGRIDASIKGKDVKPLLNYIIQHMTLAPVAYDNLPDDLKQYFVELRTKTDTPEQVH